MKFGVFLMALVEPIIAKVLLSLGFSVISIVGVDVALNTIKGMVQANMASAGSILQFGLYIWLGKGLGLIFGACATKLTLWQIQNATKIMGKSNG